MIGEILENLESSSKTYIGRYERAFALRQLTVVFIPIIAYLSKSQLYSWREFFLLALIAGISNFIYYILTIRGKFLPSLKWAQITIDVVLWTALIRITGTTESIFYLGYLLEILVSAIALSMQGCIYGAFLSGTFYTLLFFTSGAQTLQSDLLPKLLFLAAICWLCVYLIKKFLSINKKVIQLNKQLEAKVEASNEELKNILSSMTCGLIAIDDRERVIELNQAAERILEIKKDQVIGKSIGSILPESFEIERVFSDMISSAGGSKKIYSLEFRNGNTLKKLEMRPFALDNKHTAKAAALIYDITEIEKMREKVIQDKALKALGIMVASIAHDLRNPLSAMKGFVHFLKAKVACNDKEEKSIVTNLEHGISNMESTLNELLFFSNTPRIRKKIVNLQQIVKSAISFLSGNAKRLVIHEDFSENPVLTYGDAELLRRCIFNLLLNAVDFTPPGGEIKVSVGLSNGRAFITVTDGGEGVPDDSKNRIFDPFYTTKEKGTGLGLTIVKNLVELHKGTISLRSEKGRGAEFRIALPASSTNGWTSEKDSIMQAGP